MDKNVLGNSKQIKYVEDIEVGSLIIAEPRQWGIVKEVWHNRFSEPACFVVWCFDTEEDNGEQLPWEIDYIQPGDVYHAEEQAFYSIDANGNIMSNDAYDDELNGDDLEE